MIKGYSEHAANERTFLAWVRTGLATIAFGLVIEKLNLFILTLTRAAEVGHPSRVAGLSGTVGRFEGLAFILAGIALILLSAVRFVRTGTRLDDSAVHSAKSVRAELVLSAVLVVLVTSYSVYLALG